MDMKSAKNLHSYVIKNPAEINKTYDDISIYAIAGLNSVECLQTLHRAYSYNVYNLRLTPPPYEVRGTDGRTALHIMVYANLYPQVEYLATRIKADINARDVQGNTPLHYAVKFNRVDMIKLFLNTTDIDVEVMNKNFDTPLLISVLDNNIQIAKLLLSVGATVNHSLYEYIMKYGSDEMITTFKQRQTVLQRRYRGEMRQQNLKGMINLFSSNYVKLCQNLQKTPITELQSLSSKLNIPFTPETSREQLCNKISNRLSILKSNPKLLATRFQD